MIKILHQNYRILQSNRFIQRIIIIRKVFLINKNFQVFIILWNESFLTNTIRLKYRINNSQELSG